MSTGLCTSQTHLVKEAQGRYSPAAVVKVEREVVSGDPEQYVSTSYVERQNLSLRMSQRRFTRLTNGFSKKLDNHVAAVALYVAHYNLCQQRASLKVALRCLFERALRIAAPRPGVFKSVRLSLRRAAPSGPV